MSTTSRFICVVVDWCGWHVEKTGGSLFYCFLCLHRGQLFFFFSSRRRTQRFAGVSWARSGVEETGCILNLLQLNMNIKETKKLIIQAGHKAVEELINVAKEKIITNTEDDVSAARLKNAAATKKLAIFDSFEIFKRIQEEENIL